MKKPRVKSEALSFGSFFHIGLNAWWGEADSQDARMVAALWALARYNDENIGTFERVKAETLMMGYSVIWGTQTYETVAVEKQFSVQDFKFETRGSIDAIVRKPDPYHQIFYNVEHKTTSQDISPGSNYWRHIIALDSQVSAYDAASKDMGYDIRGTIYDVIRKPEIQPLKATPEDAKKYTRPTKAEPIPRLYAGQRETDETPEEYRVRLTEDIIKRPEWYFQRQTIVRLDSELEEHQQDVYQTARMILHAEENNAWPRSSNACERYRQMCSFFPVCSGESSLDDGTRYEPKARQHEELSE